MPLKPLHLIASAFAPFTTALRYAGFSSSVSCSGPSFFCEDNGFVCCAVPAGFGFSAQFIDLPSGSQGQGYMGDTCSAFLFAVFGNDTKCWNGGGNQFTHLNWFLNGRERRSISLEAGGNQTCSEASGFMYVDEHRVERAIKLPKGGAGVVASLHQNNDYIALSKYPSY